VIFDGVDYPLGRDGKYRCPWRCGDPNYPQPSWITEKGFEKHLSTCKAKPDAELVYVPPKENQFEYFGDCQDCGHSIFKMETIWWLPNRLVCIECYLPYFEAGRGHCDCAGLTLPGMALEG